MKLRIKIKHLFLAATAVIAIYILLNYVVVPRLALHSSQEVFQQDDDLSKEAVVQLIYASSGDDKWENIRHYVITGGDTLATGYDVYVGGGSVSSVTEQPPFQGSFTWEEKLPYLEMYVKDGPDGGYLARAAEQIAFYYTVSGAWERAIDQLQLAINRLPNTDYFKKEMMLRQAQLALDHDDVARFDTISASLTEKLDSSDALLNSKVAWLRAQRFIQAGEMEQGLAQINDEIQRVEKLYHTDQKGSPDGMHNAGLEPRLDQLISIRDHLQTARVQTHAKDPFSEVSGSITKNDGTPLAHAAVFLRDKKMINKRSLGSDEPYQTVTDEQGRYAFKGVAPGSYQIYLGMNYEQIDGYTYPSEPDHYIDVNIGSKLTENIVLQPLMELKAPVNQVIIREQAVTFEWEPFPGAAYYQLHAGTVSMSVAVRDHIQHTRITIPIHELYDRYIGISYHNENGVLKLDPESLLAFTDTDAKLKWSIEAYSADGRLLSRSNGYRLGSDNVGNLPFFYLKERTMTNADHLLLNGQIDEAFNQYKRDHDADPGDVHSLRMLIRLLDEKIDARDRNEEQNQAKRNQWKEERTGYLQEMVKLNPTPYYKARLSR